MLTLTPPLDVNVTQALYFLKEHVRRMTSVLQTLVVFMEAVPNRAVVIRKFQSIINALEEI